MKRRVPVSAELAASNSSLCLTIPRNPPNFVADLVDLISPGLRSVDGFSIHFEPLPQLQESFFEDRINRAVAPRPDIDQNISITAENFGATVSEQGFEMNV